MAKIIPTFAAPASNSHVNILRYVAGVNPKFRKKEMGKQLRNLIAVNDFYTLPNATEGKGLFSFNKR